MSNNNLRDQFPGIAKADTLLNVAITLGYLSVVGILILQGCLGWTKMFLTKQQCQDEHLDMIYAVRMLGWIMIANIVGIIAQVANYVPHQPANGLFTTAILATLFITMAGLVLRVVASSQGK